MLNMFDDSSRRFTGSKLYERELLLSYFDFRPAAFLAHGRRSAVTWITTASFSPTIPTRSRSSAGSSNFTSLALLGGFGRG